MLLLAVSTQPPSAEAATAISCPPGGCPLYLPLINKPGVQLKIGLSADSAGINDNGFNQQAWQAVLDAKANLGATGTYLVGNSNSGYAANINTFISQGYNLIVTVGFLQTDATKAAALAHPTQKFTIVDVAYSPALPNVISQVYAIEQSSFLCGYLAAGMTKSGKVGAYGGMNIPQVTQFIHGFTQGITYYNTQKSASVAFLDGGFTNDFNNQTLGYTYANNLINQGADVIFPVAGITGQGGAQAALDRGKWVIGVDTDWVLTLPAYNTVTLTSSIKNIRASTYAVINLAYQNSFVGGTYTGTLANQGVSLGTISDKVPAELVTEINQVKTAIILGSITVYP
jgi:basic membrane protein A